MQRIYRKLKKLFVNSWAWFFDYVYVAFWQLYGFFIRSNPAIYSEVTGISPLIKIPVILIPGIYENWRFMKPIADMLHAHGHVIHVISGLGYNIGEVETMASIVNDYIKTTALKECVIVAHSKGGLIGKFIMGEDSESIIRGMIAVNTPFAGSRYATLIPLKPVRVFLPTSPILTTLAANTSINKKIVSIFGIFDPHIPQGSFLEGATNIQLQTTGHFKIMKDKRVHEAILKSIDQFK